MLIRFLGGLMNLVLVCVLGLFAVQSSNKAASEARIKSLEKRLAEANRAYIEDHPRLRSLPNVEAWYVVQADGSMKLHSGKALPRHGKQWALLKKVVDRPIQEVYTTVVFFKMQEVQRKTMAATVVRTMAEPARYGIALNQLMYDLGRNIPEAVAIMMQLPTLVHEYRGHTKAHAINSMLDNDGCISRDRGVDPELMRFQETFWQHCKLADRTVTRDERDYHSEYAMTSVLEDHAETAAAFVLCPEPKKGAKGVLAEKLRFFWSDPESVAYRAKVRRAVITDKVTAILIDEYPRLQRKRCR